MSEDKVNCKDVMHHICESLGEDLNSDRCVAIKNILTNAPAARVILKRLKLLSITTVSIT